MPQGMHNIKMATIYDVEANELVERAAKELEKNKVVSPPVWSTFVKTGVSKMRPPMRKDWWYVRAAAILRTIYRMGPIGTQKLRSKYGGRQNRGYKPDMRKIGSGNVIRKILQQLEKSGFVVQINKEGHKGRILTPKGKSFLDKISSQILKENPAAKLEPLKLIVPSEENDSEEKTKKPKKPKKIKEEKPAEEVKEAQ